MECPTCKGKGTVPDRVCELCPAFRGRDKYCARGLHIGAGDVRVCADYGVPISERPEIRENQ
jgi:hypothetical protein